MLSKIFLIGIPMSYQHLQMLGEGDNKMFTISPLKNIYVYNYNIINTMC